MKLAEKLLNLFESKIDVLVADDDVDLADMTKEMLEDELGCPVSVCYKLQDLDNYFGKVKVVLLDSFYGKAFPFVQKFQSRGAKVYSFSGGELSDEEKKTFDGIIEKPADMDKVAKLIKKDL